MSKNVVAGCLMLVAAPFAAVGLFCSYLVTSTLLEQRAAQGWVEVPARIIEVELVTESVSSPSSTRTRTSSRTRTSTRVQPIYEYVHEGTTYTGWRLTLGGLEDGRSDREIYEELVAYRDSGQAFRCFVDPEDPAQAVLYRSVSRGGLVFLSVFALLFGGVGVVLVSAAIVVRRISVREGQLRDRHPVTPDGNPELRDAPARSITADPGADTLGDQTVLTVEDTADGARRYESRRPRNPGSIAMLIALLVPLLAASWALLAYLDQWLISAALGLVAIAVIAGILDLLLSQRTIEVRRGALRYSWRMVGPRRWQEIPAAEVSAVLAVPGSQSSENLTYRLLVRLDNGGERTLAVGLPSVRAAESLASEIETRLREP